MKRFLKRSIVIVAIALAACATTGKNATDEAILTGAEAAYNVGKTLYLAGKINDTEAQAIIDTLRAVQGFVIASRSAAAAGDASTSAAQLRAAADALDALTARLAKKG